MPVARISGHGLVAIALAVGILWGLVIAERVAGTRAAQERTRVMREIQDLQHQPRPERVSFPQQQRPRHPSLS